MRPWTTFDIPETKIFVNNILLSTHSFSGKENSHKFSIFFLRYFLFSFPCSFRKMLSHTLVNPSLPLSHPVTTCRNPFLPPRCDITCGWSPCSFQCYKCNCHGITGAFCAPQKILLSDARSCVYVHMCPQRFSCLRNSRTL